MVPCDAREGGRPGRGLGSLGRLARSGDAWGAARGFMGQGLGFRADPTHPTAPIGLVTASATQNGRPHPWHLPAEFYESVSIPKT
jgi:hypothetical protein